MAQSALRHSLRPSKFANCVFVLIASFLFLLWFAFYFSILFILWPQVRDGKYGFSDILGKFCGNQFPSIISSSDKYLWLYFHSDDNIEYFGFESVYNFTARPSNAGRETERVEKLQTINE